MIRLPRVALIGRTNVGKSTLFNRLTSSTQALVSDIPGTTRDRKEARVEWEGRQFTLIDTGGLNINPSNPIEREIVTQALAGLKKSDLILFVVDSRDGITPLDREIAVWLRSQRVKIIIIANKAETKKLRDQAIEFSHLGLGNPWSLSALNGAGTGDMLDEVLRHIKAPQAKDLETIKIAIVGKPNVGKSSLINSILHEDRVIVSDQPHTTRDANDIEFIFHGQPITLIDTAGIRRRTKKGDQLEKMSVGRSLASIERADVVLLVTEAQTHLSFQDKHIAEAIVSSGRSVIIIGNKWDLLPEKTTRTITEMTEYYTHYLPWLAWAPLIFMSAKEKTKTTQLLKLILRVRQERFKEIDQATLDDFLRRVIRRHKPSRGKGTNHPFIHSITQTKSNPPQFTLKMNFKADLHASYPRFIINNLRFQFGFVGTPIKLYIEKIKI